MISLTLANRWAEGVINNWKTGNVQLERGSSFKTIKKAEQLLNIDFPDTFKELYRRANGFKDSEWNEHMFCVWSLERIVQEHKYWHDIGFIGIADFLINSHWIGFVRNKVGIYKVYNLQGHETPTKIADTFEDSIDMINSSADDVY